MSNLYLLLVFVSCEREQIWSENANTIPGDEGNQSTQKFTFTYKIQISTLQHTDTHGRLIDNEENNDISMDIATPETFLV